MNLLINGDAKKIPLPDGVVQTCVTSPPYYGLRSYKTAKWVGGDLSCDHIANPKATKKFGNSEFNENRPSRDDTKTAGYYYQDVCKKCGAIRIDEQIGLEQTPDEYVSSIVAVFREIRRVLRPDGTVWLNLGDSYNGSGKGPVVSSASLIDYKANQLDLKTDVAGLKPKDLIGIPWRVAFALQSDGAKSPETMLAIDQVVTSLLQDYEYWELVPDKTRATIERLQIEYKEAHEGGWYLRSDIIWHKPNPMPESVKDRPTKSHEHIFLLSKSERYYYDHYAIMEVSAYDGRRDTTTKGSEKYNEVSTQTLARVPGERWPTEIDGVKMRNKRDVWSINTANYKGAHYAVFPPDLIEPCILAGTSAHGNCAKCGAPYERIIKTTKPEAVSVARKDSSIDTPDSPMYRRGSHNSGLAENAFLKKKACGWQPTCDCETDEVVSSIVLDPFVGSGTTLWVAEKNNLDAIGVDLSFEYLDENARKRLDYGGYRIMPNGMKQEGLF